MTCKILNILRLYMMKMMMMRQLLPYHSNCADIRAKLLESVIPVLYIRLPHFVGSECV